MNRKLEERVFSLMKRFDHRTMLVEHVLLGAILLYRETEQRFDDEEALLETKLRQLRSPSDETSVSISFEAEELLKRIWGASDVSECLNSFGLLRQERNTTEDVMISEREAAQSNSNNNLSDCFDMLEKLIGLKTVKEEVRKLVAVQQANLIRVQQGLPPVNQGLHLVFTGSPGTGKTTVARIMADIYKSIGMINTGQLIEVSRQDLVAGYVGQTALKVRDAIERADGGILFIDEAYSLISDSGSGFGDEAISTLVKEMEDRRSSLAVIAAGYSEEMKMFIESNPGLKSRFKTVIHFPDYSPSELKQIFHKMLADHQLAISKELDDNLEQLFSKPMKSGDAGNARYVRNLFEDAFANMAKRAAEDGNLQVSEIERIELVDVPANYVQSKSTFGFNQSL